MAVDGLEAVGLIFFLITVVAYGIVVWRVYANNRPEVDKLSVLVVRLAMFLPLYAFLIFLGLAAPDALPVLNIPITLIEGYTFYGFFTLIVTNLGGPAATIKFFQESGKPLICCNSCCPSDHVQYYKKATWAMFHLVVTRVIVIILAAGASYGDSKAATLVSAFLSLVGAVILFYCLAHLLLLYENIFTHCTNLYGVVKFMLLKFSVGLIVLQGIVEALLVTFKAEPYADDDTWSREQKTIRGYCFLVLIEFVVLCLPYLWAFTYTITNPPKPIHNASGAQPTDNFCSFFCRVLNVFDVFGVLTYKDGEDAPLTDSALNKF